MDNPSEHYTVECENDHRYLKVTVRAEVWDPVIAEHYNRRLAKEVASFNPSKILLIRDIPMTLRLVATFQLMSEFVDGLGRRKVAVVNPYPLLREDLEFVVRIATNRKEEYELFATVAEAEEWLLG